MSDTNTTLIPSVNETLDRAEKKKKIRFLNHDNSLNKDGILAAFDENEDVMTYCEASGVPLFFVTKEGRHFWLEPFGYCASNGKPYHRNELNIPDDACNARWPIQYNGYMCKEESKSPLTNEELAEIRKLYGI